MLFVLDDVMFVAHRFTKLLSNFAISGPIVRDDSGSGENVLADQWIESLFCAVGNTERKRKSTFSSFNSSEDPLSCSFFRLASVMLLLRDTRFIDLNVLACATKLLLIVAITKHKNQQRFKI